MTKQKRDISEVKSAFDVIADAVEQSDGDKAAFYRAGSNEADAAVKEFVEPHLKVIPSEMKILPSTVTIDRGSANSHCMDDQILVDGECVAFACDPWTDIIARALKDYIARHESFALAHSTKIQPS